MDDDVLTVVLVDDHQLFSRGLELLLNTDPESRVRVLARTEDASRALELVRHHQPMVAIIDLVMPPPGGLAAVEREREDRADPWGEVLDVQAAHDALLRLSVPQRSALTLRYLDGLSVPEVAEHLGACDDCGERMADYAAIGAEMRRAASLSEPADVMDRTWDNRKALRSGRARRPASAASSSTAKGSSPRAHTPGPRRGPPFPRPPH